MKPAIQAVAVAELDAEPRKEPLERVNSATKIQAAWRGKSQRGNQPALSDADDDLLQYIVVDKAVRDERGKRFSHGRMAAQISHVSVLAAREFYFKQQHELARSFVEETEGQMHTIVLKLGKDVQLAQVEKLLKEADLAYVVWNELPEKVDIALALLPVRKGAYRAAVGSQMRILTKLY